MNLAKCFEIASIVLNEATNRFSDAYVEDEEKKNEFKCFCEILDDVILRFDEVYVGVYVDEVSKEIAVTVTCGQFEVGKASDPFHELFRRSNRVSIKRDPEKEESCCIQIRFEMNGIWVAKEGNS